MRNTVSGGDACSYAFSVGNNTLPDYPHLGLSTNFLYLATNNVSEPGDVWVAGEIRRIPLDQMAACNNIEFIVLTLTPTEGQRVFVPVEGARRIMYWGMLRNTTTFTIFRWPETEGISSDVDRTIAASTFGMNDCRGGLLNRNWMGSGTAATIQGFRLRGAVGNGQIAFYWNVVPDAVHTQGHVHAAVFSESTFDRVSEPHIFNNDFCFGYPAVSANARGDLGMSVAAGGRIGGGVGAGPVWGFVSLSDDFTGGNGSFGTFFLTAEGDRNPRDGRFGDYFTVRPQTPCDLFFSATNYAVINNGADDVTNPRYVEFGRARDSKCYFGWRDKMRTP